MKSKKTPIVMCSSSYIKKIILKANKRLQNFKQKLKRRPNTSKITTLFLFTFLLQACGGEPIVIDDSVNGGGLPSKEGDALYATNCATCHSSLENSTKKERSSSSIQEAIGYVPEMTHLSSLTTEQIDAISVSLSFSAPTIFSALPAEGSEFESNITTTSISFNTNEIASCRYSLVDQNYASMVNNFTETNSFSHTTEMSVSEGNEYQVYIRCEDAYSNINDTSTELSFRVKGKDEADTKSPEITNYSPNYGDSLFAGTTETTISLTTDESATCKYSTDENAAYGAMVALSTTSGTNHAQAVSDLKDGEEYYYYFVCADEALNESLNLRLTFKVDATELSGVELYNRSCLQCHGDIDNSEVLYRTAEQIESAISTVSVMQTEYLESLNSNQIQLIADALVPEVEEVDDNELALNLILADRRYLDHLIMHKVFGKGDNEDTDRRAFTERDGYMLYHNQDHGGACDPYTAARYEAYGDYRFPWEKCYTKNYESKFVPYSTSRAAYIIRACETNAAAKVGATLVNIAAATEVIGGSDAEWSTDNFTTIYQKFFLFETPDSTVVEAFKEVFDAPTSNELGWQGVIIGLCISPEWQVL